MTEDIEIRIDTSRISAVAGSIGEFGGHESLTIRSMQEFNRWVLQQVSICAIGTAKINFVVTGPMPNCAALQIGLLLAGKGDVVFETTRKIRRKMDVV